MEKLKTMEEKLIKGGYVCTYCIYLVVLRLIYLSLSLCCLVTNDDDDDTDDTDDADAMCRRGGDIQGQQAGSGIAPR